MKKKIEIDGMTIEEDNPDLQFSFCDFDPFASLFNRIDQGEIIFVPVEESAPPEKCRRRRVKGSRSRRRPYRRAHRHGSAFWRGGGGNG